MKMIEETTEEVIPHWTEEYKVNGQISLYIIGDADILTDVVPEDAHDLGKVLIGEDEEGEPIYRQKYVREFVTGILDGEGDQFYRIHKFEDGTVGFLAMSCDGATYRNKSFNKDDADQWKYFADLVFGDRAEIITQAEYLAKIESEKETDEMVID